MGHNRQEARPGRPGEETFERSELTIYAPRLKPPPVHEEALVVPEIGQGDVSRGQLVPSRVAEPAGEGRQVAAVVLDRQGTALRAGQDAGIGLKKLTRSLHYLNLGITLSVRSRMVCITTSRGTEAVQLTSNMISSVLKSSRSISIRSTTSAGVPNRLTSSVASGLAEPASVLPMLTRPA